VWTSPSTGWKYENHRDVCCATYAGFAEFIGLPGRVRTGCPNTPAYKSPYCSLHKPVLTVPLRIQLPEDDADCEVNVPEPDKDSAKEPAGIIVEKRATRKSTFYKVNYMHHKRYYFTITIGISMLNLSLPSIWRGLVTLPIDVVQHRYKLLITPTHFL